MPRSYERFYQRKRESLTEHVEAGRVHEADGDAIEELCDAFDEDVLIVDRPNWPNAPTHITKFRTDGTLANWCYYLTKYATELRLLDTDARELNQYAQTLINRDLSKGTVRAYQNTARIFYRYHDVGIDYDDIIVFDTQDTSINPRDMLTREDIHALREAVEHPRDAAIVDLLLYCGMRNNALRTLRIKDIDTDDHVWYFNTDDSGLKHIYMPDAPRPLLGAVPSVREWLKYHPYSDEGDAYLICAKPNYSKVTPFEPVGDKTVSRVTNALKEEIGIDKPLHPHMMRHNFVSICKRDYDMDDATIKWLIGHQPDSNVMETTYSHLSGKDYLDKAQVAAGVKEAETESPFTPKFCDVCSEPITNPNAASCSNCGLMFRPDGITAQQRIEDAMYESRARVDDEQLGMDIDDLRAALNNPLVESIAKGDLTDEQLLKIQQMLDDE